MNRVLCARAHVMSTSPIDVFDFVIDDDEIDLTRTPKRSPGKTYKSPARTFQQTPSKLRTPTIPAKTPVLSENSSFISALTTAPPPAPITSQRTPTRSSPVATTTTTSNTTTTRSSSQDDEDNDNNDADDEDFEPAKTRRSASVSSKKRSHASSPPPAKAKRAPSKPSARASTSRPVKRRSTTFTAADESAESVLHYVDELASKLQRSKNDRVITLAELSIPNVKAEVKTMSDDDVRSAIEGVVLQTVSSILAGNGFTYVVPSRASSNQLYVNEIDRIVLTDKVSQRVFASVISGRKTALTTRIIQLIHEIVTKHIHVTKRDLFYSDVKLFKKQSESDEIIEDVAVMLGCTRTSLNVVASEKGIVIGCIQFREDGDLIDCQRMGIGGKAIPPQVDRITEIRSTAKFILIVEKDAAFMRLAEDRFYSTYPCIILCAKGQPDVATRLFLKLLVTELNLPVLGLVDADPYGLKILSVYMSGSKNMSYDSASLTSSNIHWLGVRPSDLDRYNIPEQCRLPMTAKDIKTGREMMEEEFISKNAEWHAELEWMVNHQVKAEIQALSSFGFQYLTKQYLPAKLRDGDWI